MLPDNVQSMQHFSIRHYNIHIIIPLLTPRPGSQLKNENGFSLGLLSIRTIDSESEFIDLLVKFRP